jgi:hypothetical protein
MLSRANRELPQSYKHLKLVTQEEVNEARSALTSPRSPRSPAGIKHAVRFVFRAKVSQDRKIKSLTDTAKDKDFAPENLVSFYSLPV